MTNFSLSDFPAFSLQSFERVQPNQLLATSNSSEGFAHHKQHMGNKSLIFIFNAICVHIRSCHFPLKVSLPVREANQKNQVHKGREQFWSLLLVAVNIAVTAFITVVVMEVGEDTLGPSKDLASLLKCPTLLVAGPGRKTGTLRWWFKNFDRVDYIIGNRDTSCL